MSAAAAIKSFELRHARVSHIRVTDIEPSPENLQLYKPVDPDDPEILALAESIRTHGVKVPLVITLDNYILSGHRRYVAAMLDGLEEVPCVVEQIYRCEAEFLPLLREYNRQRIKSIDEVLREEIVSAADRGSAHAQTQHQPHKKGRRDVPPRLSHRPNQSCNNGTFIRKSL